jgi:hypothetical protein
MINLIRCFAVRFWPKGPTFARGNKVLAPRRHPCQPLMYPSVGRGAPWNWGTVSMDRDLVDAIKVALQAPARRYAGWASLQDRDAVEIIRRAGRQAGRDLEVPVRTLVS